MEQVEVREKTYETKTEYCERMALVMTREMVPFLYDLAVPCDCENKICRGWRLKTMLRSELPIQSLSRGFNR